MLVISDMNPRESREPASAISIFVFAIAYMRLCLDPEETRTGRHIGSFPSIAAHAALALVTAEQFAEVSTNRMSSANVVGREAIDAAIKKKMIGQGHVKMIKSVPYAQAFKVDF